VSAFLTLAWIVLVVFAFGKFSWRAFWFLLGTPLVGYWLLQNLKMNTRFSPLILEAPQLRDPSRWVLLFDVEKTLGGETHHETRNRHWRNLFSV
jgi:hypothetical protein